MTRLAVAFNLLLAAVTSVRAADKSHGDSAAIPRLIIQTGPKDANGRDTQWASYQSSLKKMNPNFAYLYFDDDAALSFVDEHFAETDLPRVYRAAPKFVLKADLFRYAAVKVLGGFYMDMDMMAKASFEPLVQEVEGSGEDMSYSAVFPKEWWRSDGAYSKIYGEGRVCPDDEEHWQVGNYAFAAVPNHPFVSDALNEAMARTVRLIESTADATTEEEAAAAISDNDVLLATGPYMLSELYHAGRREGKYANVAHIRGDSDEPMRRRSYGGNDWHKFGGYAEHMLTHSWVTSMRRKMSDVYANSNIIECIAKCPGIASIDLYMMTWEKAIDLYYGTPLGDCVQRCIDYYDEYYPNEYFPNEMPTSAPTVGGIVGPEPTIIVRSGAIAIAAVRVASLMAVVLGAMLY